MATQGPQTAARQAWGGVGSQGWRYHWPNSLLCRCQTRGDPGVRGGQSVPGRWVGAAGAAGCRAGAAGGGQVGGRSRGQRAGVCGGWPMAWGLDTRVSGGGGFGVQWAGGGAGGLWMGDER